MASKDIKRKTAQVFVLTDQENPSKIIGYYALNASSFAKESLRMETSKKLPFYPVPAVIIGRFAVDFLFTINSFCSKIKINKRIIKTCFIKILRMIKMLQHPVKTQIKGRKIMVLAKIEGDNDSVEEWFCFDTGSDVVVAPKEVLKKIGAKKIKNITAEGFAGKIDGELYSISMECGGVRVEEIEVYSSTENNRYLVGMNFVMWGELGFFFDRQQLTWLKE